MEEYARLKEERLSEFKDVLQPSFLIKYLSCKACRGGKKVLQQIEETDSWELLLSSFQRSRIIKAIVKAGYSFYTRELQERRNYLYRKNYPLICDAVWTTAGAISEELVSEATVAFLEAIDNLIPEKLKRVKPSTYVFSHICGRLREYFSSRKQGFSLLKYLQEFCRIENAEEIVLAGRVRVNGEVIRNPSRKVSLTDEILIDEERTLLPSDTVVISTEPVQEERVIRKELWEFVSSTIGSFNTEILKLYLIGYSHREIAEEMGVSEEEVRKILKNSLLKLKSRRSQVEELFA